jgi:two-component system NtrC family sensor kinase
MGARQLTIRLVWLALVASVAVPLALFIFASWIDYRNTLAIDDERLQRSLDVEQEEASKVFELIDLMLNSAESYVAGMSAVQIRDAEEQLHGRLETLVAAVPLAQSIWIYGPDGEVLVSSRIHPTPPDKFSDRDFFLAHLGKSNGDYYGRVYQSVFNAKPFFTVSRRLTYEGAFVGVLEASVLPSSFFQFFSSMANGEQQQYALIRNDGFLLARYPMAPPGAADRLDDSTGFHRTVRAHPQGGTWIATSPIDHVERHFAARRIGDKPLYLTAGISSAAIRAEWMGGMALHLIFGVPATFFLFLTLLLVLRRTQRLYAEIDHRVAIEESLRQSQRLDAIGHLTGGVAHDFNNLLTIIIGNLEMASRQILEWPDAAHTKLGRRIESAMHGAKRATTLTRRLLAFSRQQPLNPIPVDINRLLTGLSEFLHRTLGEHISLEIVGAGGVWLVEVDPAELETAILNLTVNARDAMSNGGRLTIEASNSFLDEAYCRRNMGVEPGQYVVISVSDSGGGMPKGVIDRAFEPFFTTKQVGEGTGLGLSQVYGFVKQSGGHVKIYSELGEGTSVKMYLRRFMGEAPQIERSSEASQHRHTGERILAVEDDAEVRDYIAETLRGLGYEVFQAGNADEALRQLERNEKIDLLLTDVVMPGRNGRVLADIAKRKRPALKILFMTGYSRNAIVHQGRLDPGVELIQKPLSGEQLANAVRRVLNG